MVDSHLKDKPYDEERVPQWINDICEDVTFRLVQLQKPFKYMGMNFEDNHSTNLLLFYECCLLQQCRPSSYNVLARGSTLVHHVIGMLHEMVSLAMHYPYFWE